MTDSGPDGEYGRGGRLTDRIGLGVLTRLAHRDLIDEVLVDTGRTERRRRVLPARVVVYFVLAMTLFFDDAYEEVMRKLVEGLRFLRSWDDDWQVSTSSALCQARARLGSEPLRELYERVARPLAGAGTPGAWLGDLRVMAIDGTELADGSYLSVLLTTAHSKGQILLTHRNGMREHDEQRHRRPRQMG